VSFAQNTPLSLAVFAAVYRLTTDRRPFAAGLVAGLLWFKPQLLLGLFVWWALTPRRSWRCWAGVAVTGAVLAAVSWLALPEASLVPRRGRAVGAAPGPPRRLAVPVRPGLGAAGRQHGAGHRPDEDEAADHGAGQRAGARVGGVARGPGAGEGEARRDHSGRT